MEKYCRLCKKRESRNQCGFGPKLWDRYTVDDPSKQEMEDAASESGITSEDVSIEDANGKTFAVIQDIIGPVSEATRIQAQTGNLVYVVLTWKGKSLSIKMFFPQVVLPKRSEVQDQLDKVYPGCRVLHYNIIQAQPGETFLHVAEGAAWTKKEGKSKSGGLNEKGRKSYEKENPGSDLKAPSKKVGNPRRASFCARMKGMKKKLTSSKTARDPDSRINKSLRAWNCN